jgi:hypothetical protein
MDEITITPRPPELFAEVLDGDGGRVFVEAMDHARERLNTRTVWHVNSTSTGGGVAEMSSRSSPTREAPGSTCDGRSQKATTTSSR